MYDCERMDGVEVVYGRMEGWLPSEGAAVGCVQLLSRVRNVVRTVSVATSAAVFLRCGYASLHVCRFCRLVRCIVQYPTQRYQLRAIWMYASVRRSRTLYQRSTRRRRGLVSVLVVEWGAVTAV